MSLIVGCDDVSSEDKFYEDADKYWKTIPASINGMLGGYGHISNVDVAGSKKFIKEFVRGENCRLGKKRALDCGAGIGRVTRNFLLQIFDTVDLLEQNNDFLVQAPKYLGPVLASRVGEYICSGMQNVTLKNDHYDVIWVQWVTGHLTDSHFVDFLRRCQKSVTKNGLVIVKDNTASEAVEWDKEDSSVTRNYKEMHNIFMQAGMHVIKEEHQIDFPSELYKVYMFALSGAS